MVAGKHLKLLEKCIGSKVKEHNARKTGSKGIIELEQFSFQGE